jgi:hypothetical protein
VSGSAIFADSSSAPRIASSAATSDGAAAGAFDPLLGHYWPSIRCGF